MYQISPVLRRDRDRLSGLARTYDDLAEVVGEVVEREQLAPVAQAR